MYDNIYGRKKNSSLLQRIKERAQLPIFNKKNDILEIVRNNSVVIVQGGTGCGKTTQVSELFKFLFVYNLLSFDTIPQLHENLIFFFVSQILPEYKYVPSHLTFVSQYTYTII